MILTVSIVWPALSVAAYRCASAPVTFSTMLSSACRGPSDGGSADAGVAPFNTNNPEVIMPINSPLARHIEQPPRSQLAMAELSARMITLSRFWVPATTEVPYVAQEHSEDRCRSRPHWRGVAAEYGNESGRGRGATGQHG